MPLIGEQIAGKIHRESYTAAADGVFKLTTTPLWFETINIHCYDANARYGDYLTSLTVGGVLYAGDVLTYDTPIDLNEFYFANDDTGVNITIVAVGVLMSKKRIQELGLSVV